MVPSLRSTPTDGSVAFVWVEGETCSVKPRISEAKATVPRSSFCLAFGKNVCAALRATATKTRRVILLTGREAFFMTPSQNCVPQNVTWLQWGHRQTHTNTLDPKGSRISPK